MSLRVTGLRVFPAQATSEDSEPILKDVDCEFEPGEISLIIGKTGAGKSTLLDVLAGLQRPSAGKVSLDSEPLWFGKKRNKRVGSRIGLSFQSPESQLFASSVAGEFRYSLRARRASLGKITRKEAELRGRNLLREFGLPEGMMTASPLLLSGGQKRRVALATTVAINPQWLILDEPTAGLDGEAVRSLVDFLRQQMTANLQGMIIATHDLDLFLPLADRVFLLKEGRLIGVYRPKKLLQSGSLLEDIGVGLPSAMALQQALGEAGCHVQFAGFTPTQVATDLVQLLAAPRQPSVQTGVDQEALPTGGTQDILTQEGDDGGPLAWVEGANETLSRMTPVDAPAVASLGVRGMMSLDVRAKWLAYILLSIGILIQSRWAGYFAATVATLAVLSLAPVRKRNLFQLMTPFLLLMGLSVLLSGVRFHLEAPLVHLGFQGFSVSRAGATAARFYRFLLILTLGLILSATTSQLKMKQGLQQGLSVLGFLRGLRVPIEAFAFATSLTLRFIPVIMGELRRFSRIARARGGGAKASGGFRFRDVPQIVIPLILSVLHIGDELSTAMEARGYRKIGQPRSQITPAKFSRNDWTTVALGAVLLCLLLVISRL